MMESASFVNNSQQQTTTDTKEVDGMKSRENSSSVRDSNNNRNNTGVGMMKKLCVNSVILGVATIMLSAGMAQAAIIINPVGAKASTADAANRDADNTIEQGGGSTSWGLWVDSTSVQTGDPVPETWPRHRTGVSDYHWLSDGSTVSNQWIMFDLGDSYDVEDIHIWNYNGVNDTDRGVNALGIKFATESTGYAAGNTADSSWGTAITEITQFAQSTGGDNYRGETYSLTSPITARYVLFDITSNHDDPNRVGLAEVRFTGTIPEPASFLILLMAGSGLLFRRPRRR